MRDKTYFGEFPPVQVKELCRENEGDCLFIISTVEEPAFGKRFLVQGFCETTECSQAEIYCNDANKGKRKVWQMLCYDED